MQSNGHQFLSGGYYVALRSKRGAHKSGILIPPKIISASTCISEFFPDGWAIRWCSVDKTEREETAAAFHIPPDEIARVMEWATASFGKVFGWPNTFYSVDEAKAARSEFLPQDLDVAVFGLGLHGDDVEEFIRYAKPPRQQAGYAPQGGTGIYECVTARHEIAPGGRRLGFELLATFVGILTCSWLCNGLETVFEERLGIRPNQDGFITEYSDARRCVECISSGEVGAEPGLWKPWLITLYSA